MGAFPAKKNEQLPPNHFVACNIDDNDKTTMTGILSVTADGVKFRADDSGHEWTWPLVHLRKFGYSDQAFWFDTGRECSGEEEMYAFSLGKASQVFDVVTLAVARGKNDRSPPSPAP